MYSTRRDQSDGVDDAPRNASRCYSIWEWSVLRVGCDVHWRLHSAIALQAVAAQQVLH
jgi:hypothetical protein